MKVSDDVPILRAITSSDSTILITLRFLWKCWQNVSILWTSLKNEVYIWFVSPPIILESDESYNLKVGESFRVCIGESQNRKNRM